MDKVAKAPSSTSLAEQYVNKKHVCDNSQITRQALSSAVVEILGRLEVAREPRIAKKLKELS